MNRTLEKLFKDLKTFEKSLHNRRHKGSFGGTEEIERMRRIREEAIGHHDKPGLNKDPNES